MPPTVEFISIKCTKYAGNATAEKIVGAFGFTPLKTVKNQPNFEEPKHKRRVNVIVLGFDSVSHMNFIRNFQATRQYLMNNLSAFEMWGYNKHAGNTFPNMLPVYTGWSEAELISRNWTPHKFLDAAPFIWKNFSREGYRTAFAEDAVNVGTFFLGKKGFFNPPTDYYHHALSRYMAHVMGHSGNKGVASICYGNKLSFVILLELMKQLAVTMNRTRRYFQFTWSTSLTHDFINYGRNGDDYLEETLKWFHSQGYLEDTVLIFMSDHGMRGGPIRSTLQGKIEDRMPLLYFVLPTWFRNKYGAAIANLKANERRLTSHFDTHETLKDFLYLQNLEESTLKKRQEELNAAKKMPRGISLFLAPPSGRTCLDAGIPSHWCVCRALKPVTIEGNEILVEAGKQVVFAMNSLLTASPQCSLLVYESVRKAHVYQAQDANIQDASDSLLTFADDRMKTQSVTYNLVVRVKPSGGTFEATVTHVAEGRWSVSNEISRTNMYGNQSHCVQDYHLKQYCFCGN